LEKDPTTLHKAKPLYYYFHTFESKYGELPQIQKLEQRMRDLFPEDPSLRVFAHRFEYENALSRKFDPTTVQPIISPNTQLRPSAIQSIEQDVQPSYANTTGIINAGLGTSSPKRPYDAVSGGLDEPPRKFARGESPLKGAAGRRLANNRQVGGNTPLQQNATIALGGGWPVPQHINFLLSVLPNARYAQNVTPSLDPIGLVNVMRGVNLQTQSGIWVNANLKAAGRGLMDPVYHQPALPGPGQVQPTPLNGPPPAARPPPPQQMQHGPPPHTPTYGHGPPPMSLPPQQGYYPPPGAVGYAYPPATVSNGMYANSSYYGYP
jgi:cleavage stimulation factor subunit 3